MSLLERKSVDEWLNSVDYSLLNTGNYMPSTFALTFMNFIKLVNGEEGEESLTPVVHLAMLDQIAGKKERIANLCARGMAKTTLMFEYLALFIACFGKIEGFGEIEAMIYVSDSMDNGVKSARKNIQFRYEKSAFLQNFVPKATFTDNYIEFENKNGHKLGIKMFGAKTGLRGTKIFGKRPVLAVLDDLVSDDDSKSAVAMAAIKDTVYKGVDYALSPIKRKIIFNGTPFNKNDILIEAVESGAWHVNVWPICEKFPCTKAEFKGAWEDRFTYEYVLGQYEMSVKSGKVAAFMQELMLRIASEEQRIIQDSEIRYYSRKSLLQRRDMFNFYITTDLAVTEKQAADYSTISVWAYGSNGDWFWVDGIRKQQTMDRTMDDLFRLVQEYKPQSVGVEDAGQQKGFISLFQREMLNKGVWFNFATDPKTGALGIRSNANKFARFQVVVPLFKAGKIFFPEEMMTTPIVAAFTTELALVTTDGIKSKNDDCIDTISMLGNMNPWKPAENNVKMVNKGNVYDLDEVDHQQSYNPLDSYIV